MEPLNTLWQKYLQGTLTPREKLQLLQALEKDENRFLTERLLEMEWNDAPAAMSGSHENKKLLRKIRKELGFRQDPPALRRYRFRYAVAAAVLLSVTLGIWMATVMPGDERYITLKVTAGEPARNFMLPDSTVVWLNSATVLSYHPDFKNDRDVRLNGEAYFEVAHDKQHPFRVSFGNNHLLVTGTRFGIKSYEDEMTSTVGVKDGSVKVFYPSDSVSLVKDNNLIIDNRTGIAVLNDQINVDSWRGDSLRFNNIPFGEALRMLEDRYDVTVHADALPDAITRKRITITYPAGTSFEDVIEGLAILLDLKYVFPDTHTVILKH
ncbi:FecR family protein [Sinomicrobium oceani]|uniref:FecR family protein n=1 Tax=Sinomicrobium oceani TaxID=1150368 RepID=UPI00227B6877|nr:FecR domain-containing protein [Sinomicrobium oceani]